MAITLNGTTGITTPTYGGAVTAEYIAPVTSFKNRIINGAMQIDQRNAGAVQTFSGSAYSLDRYRFGMNNATAINCQQVSDAPDGFSKSLKVTCISAVSPTAAQQNQLKQFVEGFNWADMAFGTANAKTATFSFWVKSSLTGTFGGSFLDQPSTFSYPFNYTINSANTWEYKTITFAGPTSGGTWDATNGVGIQICFDIGSGTNYDGPANTWSSGNFLTSAGTVNINGTLNATWQITGVQLEKGSNATSFDYRPYGAELTLCQRYYERSGLGGNGLWTFYGNSSPTMIIFKVQKRDTPTPTVTTIGGATVSISGGGYTGVSAFRVTSSSASDFTWTASSEL
jgi:hypothetical protein